MMRIASVVVTIVGAGMIVGVVSNGLLEEGGPFVVVWIAACIGIIGLALFMSFNPSEEDEGIVSIGHEGASSTGGWRKRGRAAENARQPEAQRVDQRPGVS